MSAKQRGRGRRRQFGFVFQRVLLPELTALENVAVTLMVDGTARQTVTETAACLQDLGLADMEQRRPAEFSGARLSEWRSPVPRSASLGSPSPMSRQRLGHRHLGERALRLVGILRPAKSALDGGHP